MFEMPKISVVSFASFDDIAGSAGPGGGNVGISGEIPEE